MRAGPWAGSGRPARKRWPIFISRPSNWPTANGSWSSAVGVQTRWADKNFSLARPPARPPPEGAGRRPFCWSCAAKVVPINSDEPPEVARWPLFRRLRAATCCCWHTGAESASIFSGSLDIHSLKNEYCETKTKAPPEGANSGETSCRPFSR